VKCDDIVPRISQMSQGTSRQGSSPMRLGFGNPQADKDIPGRSPAMVPDSLPMLKAKAVVPVSCYPFREPP